MNTNNLYLPMAQEIPYELPDQLQPLQLRPRFIMDDETILSPQIPPRHLLRQYGMDWYRTMEEIYESYPVGTRVLIRRDTTFLPHTNIQVVHDYLTTRMAHDTVYGCWTHQSVAYLQNEESPYPHTVDAWTERDQIIATHYNNQPQHEHHEQLDDALNPLRVLLEQMRAEQFLQPPGLSSADLFTVRQ